VDAPVDVSIVIVNWNSRDDLARCLDSVARHTTSLVYEVVVIDSGSHDGCEAMLASRHPHVRFIQAHSNLGFARANNVAFAGTRGAAVLFLNPDTELRGPVVQRLYATLLARPDAGLVGGTLLNADGSIQTSCVRVMPTIANRIFDAEVLRRRWPTAPLWGMAALHDTQRDVHEVEALSGACLMTRRTTFSSVLGFSEQYFMYAEDIDLAHKVRQCGLVNLYVRDAVVVHYGGASTRHAPNAFAAVMMAASCWRFLRGSRGNLYASTYRLSMGIAALGRLVLIGLASPCWLCFRSLASWKRAAIEWVAILRWSVGLSALAKRYETARGPDDVG
jgi:GT2 family glycosyltransferase